VSNKVWATEFLNKMSCASTAVSSRRSYLDKALSTLERDAKKHFNVHAWKHDGTLKQLALFSHDGDTRGIVMQQLRAWLCQKRSCARSVCLGLLFAETLHECGAEELWMEMRQGKHFDLLGSLSILTRSSDKATRSHALELHKAFQNKLDDLPGWRVAADLDTDARMVGQIEKPSASSKCTRCFSETCSTILSNNDIACDDVSDDGASWLDDAGEQPSVSQLSSVSVSDVSAANPSQLVGHRRPTLPLPINGPNGARSVRAQLWETTVQHTKLQRDYDELLQKAANEERLKIQIAKYEEEIQQLRTATSSGHTSTIDVKEKETATRSTAPNSLECSPANVAKESAGTKASADSASSQMHNPEDTSVGTSDDAITRPGNDDNKGNVDSGSASEIKAIVGSKESAELAHASAIVEPSAASGKGKGKGNGKGKGKASQAPPAAVAAEADSGKAKDGTGDPGKPAGTGTGGKGLGKGTGVDGKGKGKGKPKVEPTKRERRPSVAMKTVQFDRQLLGDHIEPDTVWAQLAEGYEDVADSLPVDLIEERFGKKTQKVDSKFDATVSRRSSSSENSIKQLNSVSGDARLPYEVSFKSLRDSFSAEKAVVALTALDEEMLADDAMLDSLSYVCPSDAQRVELAALIGQIKAECTDSDHGGCDKAPLQQLAPLEQYMEKLGTVPHCRVRIDCLKLLRGSGLPRDMVLLEDQLEKFEAMLNGFQSSQCINDLLRFVLATVNLMNGEHARLNRADGFPITLLGLPGGLDAVKDANDRNLKYTIFEQLFANKRDLVENLLVDLAPCLELVNRKGDKDADGNARLKKKVVVQIEIIEQELKKHSEVLDEQIKVLNGCQADLSGDDMLGVTMPARLQELKTKLKVLVERKDRAMDQFKKLRGLFNAETHKVEMPVAGSNRTEVKKVPLSSEVWCQIWDNFFLCEQPFLRADSKTREEMAKLLCKPDACVTVDNLEVWWGLRNPGRTSRRRS